MLVVNTYRITNVGSILVRLNYFSNPPVFHHKINKITIMDPIKYPKALEKAILIRSAHVLDSTIYPTKGSPRNGLINAKNIIPKKCSSATNRM